MNSEYFYLSVYVIFVIDVLKTVYA